MIPKHGILARHTGMLPKTRRYDPKTPVCSQDSSLSHQFQLLSNSYRYRTHTSVIQLEKAGRAPDFNQQNSLS
jgi:hypothetical protein